MPAVQQLVATILIWQTCLLQSRPEYKCREYLVAVGCLPYSITHEPGSCIYLAHLIAIMVIGAHTAAKGKSLVDGIIPYKEVVLCRLLRVVVIGIIGKTSHHLLQVIPRHLALLAVKLVGSNNRRTRKTLA